MLCIKAKLGKISKLQTLLMQFMKRYFFILSAALISMSAAAKPKQEAVPTQIKVMSYNIRLGTADDGTNSWQYRYPATGAMIEDQKPDVFGVQECLIFQEKFITTNFDGHQGRMSYKCVGVGRDDGKKGEKMDIFYNAKTIKLLKWGTYWLSETPEVPGSKGWDARHPRTATWALMKDKKSGKQFYFVNTHLDHKGAEARRNSLALIVDRIAAMNPDGYPMVLMGDFNISPDNAGLVELNKIMKSARIYAEKTDSEPSFNGWGKSAEVIDYIYYSGFSNCKEFKTVTKSYLDRKFISDHNPVTALLVF